MNILQQVTTGVVQVGARIVLAGQEKIGKTTLGCGAPGVLLVQLEQGGSAMTCAKTPQLSTWQDVEQLCLELIDGAQRGSIPRGSSIVWDSATALERFIHSAVLKTDPSYMKKNATALTMESALGGYGKAYQYANELFERWTRYQDDLARHGGINIIVTCHTFAARVVDPAHGEYDTWDLLLHSPRNQKTYGKREFITQWADMVGFLHEPMFVMKANAGEQVVRGISQNQGRQLAVERTPAWVAGNRFGVRGNIPIPTIEHPSQAPNAWNAIATAIHAKTGLDVFNRAA